MNTKNLLRIVCSTALALSGLVSMLLPVGVAQAGSNLVLNPSFEIAGTGGAADAANWTEGVNHTRASDKFNTGAWSLKSTYTGTGTDTRQTVSVIANTTYTYSGYIWRSTTAGGSCMDMNDIVGERQLCTTTTGSWVFLTGSWSSGSNTSVTLRMITDGSPNNSNWFDDISLADNSPTPTNTPVGPTNTPTRTSTPTNTPAGPTNTPTNTPTPAVTGSVLLQNGACCVGGPAGSQVTITAAFSAQSSVAPVNEMRVHAGGGNCVTDLSASSWEPFVTSKDYYTTAPIGWSGFYVTVQFRDTQNNLSALYCDDISVEGTPVTVTPATPTNTPVAPSNLVLNPSFETAGTGGAADAANWAEGVNHTRASDKFNTGAWSLKSTYTGSGTDTRTTVAISVLANHTYTYSGYIWKASTTGVGCMDMNDIAGETQFCATTTGSWQFRSGTWNSGSHTSVTLRMITASSPNGNIWFDDISLQ
jgi:hypothetical protein